MRRIRSAALAVLDRALPRVRADMAALHAVGPDLTPLADGVPAIRMSAESVIITLFETSAVVEADFHLTNDGPETTIPIGFPAYGRPSPFKSIDVGLFDFAATVHGTKVVHGERRLDNATYPCWYAWDQTFPARATSRVSVRYWTPLLGYAASSRLPFLYVLRTGRFWKDGRIGSIDVTVRAGGIAFHAIREATPEGFVVDATRGELRWSWRDHVPEQDIGLLVSPLVLLSRRLEQRVHDPRDVLAQGAPPGMRWTVVGTPSSNPFDPDRHRVGLLDRLFARKSRVASRPPVECQIMGERRQDQHIVIPDGIRALERDDPSVSLRLMIPADVTETRREVASFHRGWWKAMVSGVLRCDAEGRFLEVDEWVRLTLTDPSPETPTIQRAFPWVTGNFTVPRDWMAHDRPGSAWLGDAKPGSRQRQPDEPVTPRSEPLGTVPHDA